MNRQWLVITGFGILFLFFIQMAGMLVESIYILDLLKTSLDEKALGVLFFFAPLFLLLFKKRAPRWLVWFAFMLLFLGRGVAPYLNTSGRMLAAGIATGAALILIPILLAEYLKSEQDGGQLIPAQGLALAVGLSILLRTVNYTIDISLVAGSGWIGWLLAALLGFSLIPMTSGGGLEASQDEKGVTSASVGVVAALTLVYFAFASPGVIARWTEGNYPLIVMAVSLFSLLWLFISLVRPGMLNRMKPTFLILWNLSFTIALTWTILAHTIRFPATPDSPAVVVATSSWSQQIPLILMLILFPVLFIDFAIFSGTIARAHRSPRQMVPGFLLGTLFLVILVFMNIFTNVWGYVEPISPFFRNKFWLPYLVLSGAITLLVLLGKQKTRLVIKQGRRKSAVLWMGGILGIILVGTLIGVLLTDRPLTPGTVKTSLKVMTYNIQQANDVFGEKAYDRQLALIRKVDPDILGLQESDSARISLGNNDYVRYYANKLGYYAYYGPKTVTGTYGTALLSKYPLENPLSFFSYSDQDEIGTVEAQMVVGGQSFTVYVVHPDGSDEAMMAFAKALLKRAGGMKQVIAIGDYNLRAWEEPYQLIAAQYKNAWTDVYPTGVDTNGLDMSGENRIDHIFISPHLLVSDPVYLLPPESATDHPAHWADISW